MKNNFDTLTICDNIVLNDKNGKTGMQLTVQA